MVGIEIGILGPMQSIGGPDHATVITESTRGVPGARNAARARVRWRLGIEQARIKPGRAYPTVATNGRYVNQSRALR